MLHTHSEAKQYFYQKVHGTKNYVLDIPEKIIARELAGFTTGKLTTLANHLLQAVHPKPDEAYKMPYAPAVRIVGACNLMFFSGATASALYHHK